MSSGKGTPIVEQRPTSTAPSSVKVAAAKGRPMLSWVGKRPLREVREFPAQLVERFSVDGSVMPVAVKITDMLGEEVFVLSDR